jgi:hypothetical protein
LLEVSSVLLNRLLLLNLVNLLGGGGGFVNITKYIVYLFLKECLAFKAFVRVFVSVLSSFSIKVLFNIKLV